MHNSRAIRLAMVVVTVWALAAMPAWAASNKYRIQVSEGAKSDGEIVFAFSPEGVAAFEVAVPIAKGTGENAVARKIRDVLREKLDPKAYSVEVDDGEDVLVKKAAGQPNFGLKVASNSVKAVRIGLDRE
ncbi:MAG: hypothetical protein KBI44_21615 [Thermoanaerobaculia bacterium]|jgi:hypothetical protein|nr:hypothetical protein [Thermoanaerobaculia bacterium]